MVTQSPNMSVFPTDIPPLGFSNIKTGETLWRVFLLEANNSTIKIEVAEKFEVRGELIEDVLITIFTPLIFLVPLIAIVVWAGLRKGLAPVNSLSVEVEGRSADNLKPLETTDIPKEIKPLTASIDHLMGRMEDTIENERQFTDNAAHELRTPLAAIKTLAQVAKDHSSEDISNNKLNEILDDLVLGTDRATHLVEQLLDFARLNNKNINKEEVNLSDLFNNFINIFKNKLTIKDITLKTNIDENIKIFGHKDTLSILIRNIIDNACKYTPSGGTVAASLSTTEKEIVLNITDSGIGIPDKEKNKVMERFYRVPNSHKETSKVTGCGLGLAITKHIADLHSASLTIKDNPEGTGTSVSVIFKQTSEK